MTRATRSGEYTRQLSEFLYLAFELGISEWKLSFITDLGAKPRMRVMPARDLERLTREITEAKQFGRDGAELL